jgi:hypothetical protein
MSKRILRFMIYAPILGFLFVLMIVFYPPWKLLKWLDDEPVSFREDIAFLWAEYREAVWPT